MFIKLEVKDNNVAIINTDDISHIYKNDNGIEIHFKNRECMSFTPTENKESINDFFEYFCNEMEIY